MPFRSRNAKYVPQDLAASLKRRSTVPADHPNSRLQPSRLPRRLCRVLVGHLRQIPRLCRSSPVVWQVGHGIYRVFSKCNTISDSICQFDVTFSTIPDEKSWTGLCSSSCGGGVRSKFRFVLSAARNGGVACPALQQVRHFHSALPLVHSSFPLSARVIRMCNATHFRALWTAWCQTGRPSTLTQLTAR